MILVIIHFDVEIICNFQQCVQELSGNPEDEGRSSLLKNAKDSLEQTL